MRTALRLYVCFNPLSVGVYLFTITRWMRTDHYLRFGRSWNSSLVYYIRPAEFRAESLALVSWILPQTWFYPCLRIATEDFAVITHPFALKLGQRSFVCC